MAHQCEFLPSKRIMKIQMAMAMKFGEGGMTATNSGNEDITLEWRCKFCLRAVEADKVPHYGIEDTYDREAAMKEPPPESAKPPEVEKEEVLPVGAFSPDEQEALLKSAGVAQ